MPRNEARQAIDQVKQGIMFESGIEPGADAPARINGEITKRLVQLAEQQLSRRREAR
ncbi:small, acid-soluble spore protein, alpha/beta type [Domibacillus indicus]|uniref:small, acid-soluble spore protein, alpha/beta type n=1 Tax=Domibacillus indicus TaxID=1437523 RepID=UPI0009E3AC7A|nr:small, acid-soluble spore protein, alpha/beta type [Domibacillus indicus]